MQTAQITPLIITFNEGPNLRRSLERLTWANRIVVLDSGSTDDTLDICRSFANVHVVHRPFQSFAEQCNFGLTQIETEWVLSLDADYLVPRTFSGQLDSLEDGCDGYAADFRYCVFGKPLRACLYPPRTVLYRVHKARYQDIGHGHRVVVDGNVGRLPEPIDHDDRKSLDRWLSSQSRYAVREAEHLTTAPAEQLNRADRIRLRIWPAVPAVFIYTLIVKRAVLDGWPGWYYTFQRAYAELLLSLQLLDRRLRSHPDQPPG